MSLVHTMRAIAGRLSLRKPQAESRRRLVAALEAVPALRDHRAAMRPDLAALLEALNRQSTNLSDFERDFPSLCFALATGVVKTRSMGAFISDLNLVYSDRYCP